jgi:hypothetical protein
MRPEAAAAFLLLALVACGTASQKGADHLPSPEALQRRLDGTCAAVATPSARFDFRSSFWLNLHNFLYREAKRARGVEDDGLLAAGNLAFPLTPARPLATAERTTWEAAVAYYRDEIYGASHPDSVVITVNDALARSTDPALRDVLGARPGMRAALLSVADVYRDVWWPDHDRRNREWIADARAGLDRYETCLAPRLAEAFAAEWPDRPIPVHVTVYASWAAAYTTYDPPRITISSVAVGSQGLFAVELLLHEAGHTLMLPLERALERTANAAGRRADPRLAHLLLFYTAGDLVWRAVPGYPTAAEAFGVWRQNEVTSAYRDLLRREWRPYLAGTRTLDEAIAALGAAKVPAP